MAKKSHKILYLLIGLIICLAGIGGFFYLKISIYQKELSRIDSKVDEAIQALNFSLLNKRIKWVGPFPIYLQVRESLKVPFDYPLDRLPDQIQRELSRNSLKIHQVKRENLKDRYKIVVSLGFDDRITHTLEFVLHKLKIALLIDDFGYSQDKTVDFLLKELDLPFTISVIPGTPYAKSIAEEAHRNGKQVILHLPMEPQKNFINRYRWIVLNRMSPEQISSLVKEAIKDVPYVAGLSNHMGSLITTQEKPMRAVLEAVKADGLYFVDSKTVSNSVAFPLAQKMGIKSTQRQVFLDNQKDSSYIESQFQLLISSAQKREKALGIAHADPITAEALKKILSRLEKRKIQLVYVSDIVG
ncbi:MAG: divergent polysaccharide deacetylase family protein [bacterium]